MHDSNMIIKNYCRNFEFEIFKKSMYLKFFLLNKINRIFNELLLL